MHLKGVLFFPVTPFGADGRLAEEMLARHVDQGVAKGAGGVFAACGTGEFHALDADEYERVVRVAVETTRAGSRSSPGPAAPCRTPASAPGGRPRPAPTGCSSCRPTW